MDPFVRQLVERLHDPSRPLSRNRHFHTFDNPLGRAALRVSRRLKALQKDVLACRDGGGRVTATRGAGPGGEVVVEVRLEKLRSRRTATLETAEFELLCELPGVGDALRG